MVAMTAFATDTDPRPAPALRPATPDPQPKADPPRFLLRGPLAVFRRPLRRPREG